MPGALTPMQRPPEGKGVFMPGSGLGGEAPAVPPKQPVMLPGALTPIQRPPEGKGIFMPGSVLGGEAPRQPILMPGALTPIQRSPESKGIFMLGSGLGEEAQPINGVSQEQAPTKMQGNDITSTETEKPSERSQSDSLIERLGWQLKSKVLHGQKVGYDTLPRSYREAFQEGLAKAVPEARTILEQTYYHADYIMSEAKGSYYSQRKEKKTITLGLGATPSTLAHELFHMLDDHHEISKTLSVWLIQDYIALNVVSNGEIKEYLIKQYPGAFTYHPVTGKANFLNKHRGIADILNGLADGNIEYGFGHDKEYWAKPGKLEAESWAQFGRILYENNPETMEILSECFPNFMKYAMMLLKGLIK